MRTIIAVILLLPFAGCSGSSAPSQPVARDSATSKACDKYAECGQVGSGKNYPTREDCDVDQRAYWNKAWPSERCDGKIDQAAFNDCLLAIQIIDCNNVLEILNVLGNKCSANTVCPIPDGG